MGAKIQAFDIFQTPLSSHYPLPLSGLSEGWFAETLWAFRTVKFDNDKKGTLFPWQYIARKLSVARVFINIIVHYYIIETISAECKHFYDLIKQLLRPENLSPLQYFLTEKE